MIQTSTDLHRFAAGKMLGELIAMNWCTGGDAGEETQLSLGVQNENTCESLGADDDEDDDDDDDEKASESEWE